MVEKKRGNEVAVLFEVKFSNDERFDKVFYVPKRVIEGDYDELEQIFIGKDKTGYAHIAQGDLGLLYGKRMSLAELFRKYPKCTKEEAKEKFLKDIKQNVYYEDDEIDLFVGIAEYNSSKNTVGKFEDIDTEMYLKTIEEEFPQYFSNDLLGSLDFQSEVKTTGVVNKSKTNFSIKEMYDELSKTVIGQDDAHRKILSTIWRNFSKEEGNADNIFVNGPTGVGKTETFRKIAEMMNVPIIIEDCNEFTQAGYVGKDVNKIIEDLYKKSNNNIEVARRGIVVLDELDKIADTGSQTTVSTTAVQDALLKMLEDGQYTFSNNAVLNTNNITFVGLGAFSNIEHQDPVRVGFGQDLTRKTYSTITLNDIVKYGMKPELMGRFSTLVSMKALTSEQLEEILLTSKISPLIEKIKFYKQLGIDFEYTDEFIKGVANEAKKLNTGARALKSVLSKVLSDVEFTLAMSDSNTYTKVKVDKDTVEDSKKYILGK